MVKIANKQRSEIAIWTKKGWLVRRTPIWLINAGEVHSHKRNGSSWREKAVFDLADSREKGRSGWGKKIDNLSVIGVYLCKEQWGPVYTALKSQILRTQNVIIENGRDCVYRNKQGLSNTVAQMNKAASELLFWKGIWKSIASVENLNCLSGELDINT